MKGILVEPPCDISFTMFPPLGLLSLHAACEGRHAVDVLDLSLRPEADLFVRGCQGDGFIGVSCRFTYNAERTRRFIRRIRDRYPRIWILTGGQHASFDLEGMLGSGADVVALHEGEDTLPRVLDVLEKGGEDLATVPGIAYRDAGGVIVRSPDGDRVDLRTLRSPSFHLVAARAYGIAKGYRGVSLEASRGCVNHCRYCCTSETWRRQWRGKDPEQVAGEMDDVAARGFNFLYFADDNFCRDLAWGDRFLGVLERRKRKTPYMCCVEPTTVLESPGFLTRLERSGCMVVYMSIDSIHDEVLADYRRPVRFDQIRRAVERFRGHSICLISNVILGNPRETLDQMTESLRYARANVDIPTAGSLEARPGNGYWRSEMFAQSRELGQGSAFLHPEKKRVNRLLMKHLLETFLSPRTLARTFFSRKEGTRFMLRFHYKLYFFAMIRKIRLAVR